ncbi:LOW QUALITY PROTEIN: Hypothetical protein PHPALM_13086 [Phytophthora palmivora]|uniref:Retrotransposon gag domain-containing protein n=1 Tax=Phytophthora palmivora TaxID=4796 RepID=A0A2P4XY28_9STRA|nr:LOW QUALITY PROTEIN: Hypothetical protein PHPALM_13086 [Phytophthora palmivora]
MTKGTSMLREDSPATAKSSPHAGISAASFADSADSAIAPTMDATADGSRSVQFEEEDAQGHASDEKKDDEDYEEKAELGYVKTTAELLGEVGELSLQVGRMGVPRPVERNLAAEFGEDADDEDQGVAQGERLPLVPRATRNADTPSANKVLAQLGGEMMRDSEWMKLFAPVPLAQARWPSLGPLLAGLMEWSDTAEVAETTILLLQAMGFRVTSRPSPWILSDWNLDLASVELLRWRGKLRKAFGLQMVVFQLGGMEYQLGEMPNSTSQGPKGGQPATNPSKITTMKTPETKKGERFRATAGTPYFEDSHMLSQNRTRLGRNKWESEEDNSAEAEEDSDDDHGYRPSRDDTIYHLSNDRCEQGGSQYLELRSHVSLDKIAQFDGRQYRSDDSLQWLKRFIYEMKGTHMPQDSWCEPFSLSLGRTAKSWYRQLPRKAQTRWNLLSEAFLDYYCSQFDQSARTDDLRLLDSAKWYERGGADAADHVEQFLLNCGDDDIMDMLYPLQLNDSHRVEQIINKKILGEKRKKQRDRLVSGRSRDEMRRDDRRNDRRRDDKRDGRREISDRRREESRDGRINTADYVVEELYGSTGHTETGRGQLSRDAELYDSEDSDGYSAYDQDEDAESEDDTDYVDAGFTNDRDSAGTPRNSARPFRGPTEG